MPEKIKSIPFLSDKRRQELGIAREMLEVRNPELLEKRVIAFLREQGFPSHEVQAHYASQKPLLENVFGNPDNGLHREMVFHGTGMYKYEGEKYRQDTAHPSHSQQRASVLETIFQKGLQPHFDPWLLTHDVQSISFAPSYFYAKWYAEKYTGKDTNIEWQFGDPFEWFLYFMADTMRTEAIDVLQGKKKVDHKQMRQRKSSQREQYPNKLYHWISSLRSDVTPQTPFMDILKKGTDISNNWGGVLCIPQSRIHTIEMKFGGTHEIRTDQLVSPSAIEAMGVPLQRMDEAKKLIASVGSHAQVFALECADLHLAPFDFSELVKRA